MSKLSALLAKLDACERRVCRRLPLKTAAGRASVAGGQISIEIMDLLNREFISIQSTMRSAGEIVVGTPVCATNAVVASVDCVQKPAEKASRAVTPQE
jgi:hypothetical protein